MSVNWTPAQRQAIEARGGALLISAAAGSGKTAVLVERVVRMLCDPLEPVRADRLLIVTFTNAAAAQLRARIGDALTARLAENPGSLGLRRQRLLLQKASICTIDAFCLQLLQNHFHQLDIPPDFTAADEAGLLALQNAALDETLERAYQDPDFRAFADLYGRSRTDRAAGAAVLKIHDFARTLPHFGHALQELGREWMSETPFARTRWAAVLLDEAARACRQALRLTRAALAVADGLAAPLDKYAAPLRQDTERMECLEGALAARDWDGAAALAAGFAQARLPSVRNSACLETDQIKALRKEAKSVMDRLPRDLLLCTAAEFEEDRRRAAPLVAALLRAVADFERTFFAARVEEKTLDFSDFEHLALRLLQNEDGSRTPLAETVSGGFDVVMVDEYQDTNALQDALYHCLAKPDGSNLFFVGDLKQSIYRFRQADPQVFLDKLAAFRPLGQGWPARLALDANFRSAPQVIRGINYCFSTLMSPRLGGVEYGDGQRLVPGADTHGFKGSCEIQAIPAAGPAADADYIARRIRAMVEAGVTVREGGGERPCRWEDFCILLRTRANMDVYLARLEQAGAPVYADTAEDLLEAVQVRPVAALLRVLDNPAQDVYLAAVMLSGLGGFTPDDLVRLRTAFREGSLYGAVSASQEPGTAAFFARLQQLRRLARTLPVDRLLEEIFARTGYLAAVGAMENGQRRREDLLAFARWAGAAGRAGLPALVRAMDAAAEGEGLRQGGAGESRPGCVTIMTVHRSKGLEFPIVFVADTARRFNLRDLSEALLPHARLGLGLVLRAPGRGGTYPTAAHRAVQRQLRAESLSEEMRVQYVALTRARDRLIITVPLADPEKELGRLAVRLSALGPDEDSLAQAQSPGEWYLTAALLHPDGRELRTAAGCPLLPADTDSHIAIGLQAPAPGQQADAPAGATPPAAPDPALAARLADQFAWRYFGEALTRVPAKVSVTALTHGQQEALPARPAFMSKGGLSGAERGTALHAFLQQADLARAAADPAAELARQRAEQRIAPELADHMELDKLRTFFASELFGRIRRADRVLREYAFITALPAERVAGEEDPALAGAQTLVQGVADLVLLFSDHAEIVDYKTDRHVTPEELVRRYAAQLRLYAGALAARLPVPVTRCTLYSFSLGREIDLPAAPAGNWQETGPGEARRNMV